MFRTSACEAGDLSKKEQITEACLTVTSVTIKANFYDYDCEHNAWQDIFSKRGTVGKLKVNNMGRWTLRRTVAKEHITTAAKWQQNSIVTLKKFSK